MATNQRLTQFVVWAPDYTDPGAAERRLAVRTHHLDNARKLATEGIVRLGGGVLSSDPSESAALNFFGSCLIVEAESLQAARELMENDIYYTSRVWDRDRLLILPIMLATSLPPVSA